MSPYWIIFLCGGLGCVCRFAVASAVGRTIGSHGFPWSTLCVNGLGAFLIGALTAWGALQLNLNGPLRYALVVGFLGGFTTFSAFSLETMLMLDKGAYAQAALYIALSVGGTVALAFLGSMTVRAIT